MKKIFGTDGVRGLANTQITCELAFNIGKAVAIYAAKKCSQIKPKILVVRDTRTSGDMLQCAICAGITSMGIDVVTTEILPTPAVHVLVKKRFSSMGVMITASHNPPEYNGIKIINELGLKLSDEEETEIEQILADISNYLPCDPSDVGVITFDDELPMTFAEYELKALSENLEGISICLDCANGATYQMAPYIFKRAGAKIDVINDESDGVKINVNCGSTHIEQLSEYIKDKNFDLGFAFDGDGDRMIAVLGDGTVLGGDEMIFLTTYYYADKKILNNNVFATNIITNCGIDKSLEKFGVKVERITAVGGKPLQKIMIEKNINLAAEDNGHIIFGNYNHCSDGIICGLILSLMVKQNYNLKDILKKYIPFKQCKVDVNISERQKQIYLSGGINEIINDFEHKLKDDGRIVVRPSGTEPLIRIMVEGTDFETIEKIANKLKDSILAL